MTPRSPAFGPGLVLLLALLAGGWLLQRGVEQDQNVYVQARLLQEVVDHIADQFVEPVERGSLYDSAIDGMIRGLDDPNSSLLGAEDYENFRIQTEGDYGGVGLEIVDRDDHITVVSPLPGTPGFRAGIRAGDEIVEVEGRSTRGWTSQQAVQILRGRPGSEARVMILRPGMEEPTEFTLVRERIQLQSVPFAVLLEEEIGYVPLDLFSETSTEEVRAAVDSLRSEGARSLILDLRGNPGGILDQGIGIADLFLDRGAAVAETRGQDDSQEGRFRARGDDQMEGLPLVVLLDQGSASASEIVAGALQDHDRAVVLGTPSFGKGSVQTLFQLTGGNVLKLTTARWYTPRGRSIEGGHSVGEDANGDAPRALTVSGQYVRIPEMDGRPSVTSYAGRDLLGGGGIVPDLIVLPDTLSAEERRAVQDLYGDLGLIGSEVFNFAVRYLQEREASPGFALTDGELAAFYAGLDPEVDRGALLGADRYLRRQLETAILVQSGGERAAFLHEAASDVPLRRALELLAGVEGREELFVRAGSPIPDGALAAALDGPDPGAPSSDSRADR